MARGLHCEDRKRLVDGKGNGPIEMDHMIDTPVNNECLQLSVDVTSELTIVDNNNLSIDNKNRPKVEEKHFLSSLCVSTKSRSTLFVEFFKIFVKLYKITDDVRRKTVRTGTIMRFSMLLALVFVVVQLLPVTEASEPLRNPYQILSVNRRATLQEIRKAYKNLVKEWHPDKTDHPAAENKFVEITRAYEVTSHVVDKKFYFSYLNGIKLLTYFVCSLIISF